VTIHEDGVAVIDQRRAHERVLYERILRQGGEMDHSGQALLFSVTIKLAGSMRALLQEYRAEFASIGFNLDIHADGSVHVIAVPSDVSPGTEEAVLHDMLHTLESYGPVPTERRRERLAAGYASKMAVLRSEQLVPAERDALVRDLFACSVPHITPSGAPTYVVMTWSEVERRIQ
jgi:DNA mismatch repair protein MutL